MGELQSCSGKEEFEVSSGQEDQTLIPLANQKEKSNTPKPFLLSVPNYVPSFEGLRGLAIIGTCSNHILPGYLNRVSLVHGRIGLNIFFVMSGFLVTGILAGQQQKHQQNYGECYAHLSTCYTNRLFRLYPALLLMVISTTVLQYLVHNGQMPFGLRANMANALLYLCNFEPFGPHAASIWKNTYSIANQEQWYFIWSIVLPHLLKTSEKKRIFIINLFIALSLTGRLCNDWELYKVRMFRWDGVIAGMCSPMLGALLRLSPSLRMLQRKQIGNVGLALCLCLTLDAYYDNEKRLQRHGINTAYFGFQTYSHVLSLVTATFLVMGSTRGMWLFETHLLRFFGRISYSWYLYQVPLLLMMGWPRGYVGFAYTCVAFCMAMFSTMYVEEPIANWNRNRRNLISPWKASRD